MASYLVIAINTLWTHIHTVEHIEAFWNESTHKLMFWIFNAFVYMSILTSSDVLNKRPNPWRITYFNRKPHLNTNTDAPKYKVRGKCYCGDVHLLSICPSIYYQRSLPLLAITKRHWGTSCFKFRIFLSFIYRITLIQMDSEDLCPFVERQLKFVFGL